MSFLLSSLYFLFFRLDAVSLPLFSAKNDTLLPAELDAAEISEDAHGLSGKI